MKENLVKAEKKTLYIVICCIGILFFLFLAILTGSNYPDEKIEGMRVLLGPALLFIWILIFAYALIQMPNLFYNSVKIEFRTIFGTVKKSIFLNDIESWVSQQKKSKHDSWEDLILITKDQKKHRLHSYHYSDFEKIKQLLTNGKKKNEAVEKELEHKQILKYAKVTFILGILFFLSAFLISQNKTLKTNEIVGINGVLSKDIMVKKQKKTRILHIFLENYPKQYFKIRSTEKNWRYKAITENYKKGSAISFKIEKEDFEKKILSNPDLNLIEKYWNPYEVTIVELKDQNNTYQTLEDYNEDIIESRYSLIGFFVFFGIILFVISGVFYKNRNNLT
ncbi:hypothetical protein [Flavobacterium hungaricum]|uniref:PH domain-containing protein n=1 Tax=Flavobacterium hungaricum TaxID=2082725 RepID=A0ABR9TK33_9FLAO|nr:hypothetical protein [Flavobacterium hungaricum]MBE8725705.1 hypothetical protein [Flavobacterium hungaricum]